MTTTWAGELRRRLHTPAESHPVISAERAGDWQSWLTAIAPDVCTAPFGSHHGELWEWVWAVQADTKPEQAFVAVWPRGSAKSASAELAVLALAARNTRRYGIYVSSSWSQANDHVQNVADLLESSQILAEVYPQIAERAVGKYGQSKGWRLSRLRTASGFTLDALGLDAAARGLRIDSTRPDLIIFDDIDEEDDTSEKTRKKIDSITRKLLPAGSKDAAVLAIQNLVIEDGVFARLADKTGQSTFLRNRILSGPMPAVENLAVDEQDGRWVITGGTPTWEGQNLEVCQQQIDDWGITAFKAEAQHEVSVPPGGMYDHLSYAHCNPGDVPDLVRVVVWVDPAVTDTDQSDSHAIQADGIDPAGVIYRLHSWEHRATPEESLRRALRLGWELKAEKVGVETDQGGDTWRSVYNAAAAEVATELDIPVGSLPVFDQRKAGAGHGGKVHRSSQMLADYERPGRIVHVIGTHDVLEKALDRFPRSKPFDLVDAAFWSWRDLRVAGPSRVHNPAAAGVGGERWEQLQREPSPLAQRYGRRL